MAKKRSKRPAWPQVGSEPPPMPQDHPAPQPIDARVAELVPLASTTPVLVRLPVDDYAAIVDWTERQNASEAKREAVITKGKGAGVKVPDFIRQAVKEKLAHIARSGKKK